MNYVYDKRNLINSCESTGIPRNNKESEILAKICLENGFDYGMDFDSFFQENICKDEHDIQKLLNKINDIES